MLQTWLEYLFEAVLEVSVFKSFLEILLSTNLRGLKSKNFVENVLKVIV